ncbi:MAG: amidohydrolase family protein [Dysosmobacter sp.]
MLKNAAYVNVFSNEPVHHGHCRGRGLIVGMGSYHGTVRGGLHRQDRPARLSWMPTSIWRAPWSAPRSSSRPSCPTAPPPVITDPHEIANVMGTDGIEYMLQATEGLPVDVRFMLPSCVPATPLDESGAILDYRAIDSFYDHPRVQGLAEMMNFVGIIAGDDQTGGEDRGGAGPPQEDRRPRPGPDGQRPQRLHRRRRLLRPRVP